MLSGIMLLCKKSQLPHHTAFMILEESLFLVMMGKSSWVHSRTQGFIPMLFCRWSNILWLLHPLLVPSNGRWLDQGRWSLHLLFCFCGNDRTMALYQTKCVCVIFELWSFRYLRTWFVIILSTPMYFYECGKLDVIVNGDRWTYYNLGCMYELWFEILRDFTDYQDYMGLSSVVWLCKWSLSGLISYNLGGSTTAGIGARFSELLFISTL